VEKINLCAFCKQNRLKQRIIRINKFSYSFVSNPWFRTGHCLVVPIRHLTQPSELNKEEASEIMLELARLSSLLDEGYGTGIMQKYQPLQQENEIKQNHLHFHVFPRLKEELHLFPTPEPNDFSGFYISDNDIVQALIQKLK